MDSKAKAEILKGVILSKYKSIRQFAVLMNIPYSTLIFAAGGRQQSLLADRNEAGYGEILETEQNGQEESTGYHGRLHQDTGLSQRSAVSS